MGRLALKIPSETRDSWSSGAAAEVTAVARRPRPEHHRHRLVGKGARRRRCLRRRVSLPLVIQNSGSVVFSRRFLELPRCFPGPRRRGGAALRFPLLPTGRGRCRKFTGGTRLPASVFWKSWAQVVERNGQCWGTTISAQQARHAPLSLPAYFSIRCSVRLPQKRTEIFTLPLCCFPRGWIPIRAGHKSAA